jgi:hypothetical protein
MTTTPTTTRLSYRGQYRARSNRGPWLTLCERASEPATWDELLTMPALSGCDLRVVTIRHVEPVPGAKLFTFGDVRERQAKGAERPLPTPKVACSPAGASPFAAANNRAGPPSG